MAREHAETKVHRFQDHMQLIDDGYLKFGDDDDARLTADGTGVDITGSVIMSDIPTSDPSVAGQLWSNGGVVTVSAG